MRSIFQIALLLGAAAGILPNCYGEEKGPKYYQANWESLRHYQVPEWYYDAKFGIWPIWGPYSVPAYRGNHAAEWYPRWMYLVEDSAKPFSDYEMLGADTAKHHRETYGDPGTFGYHDFIPMFKAEKWNPDEWAQFGVECGAKFFTVISEFHDGFAMYDSSYTPWNSAQMGPKRDVTGELAEAVRKRGLKFGVSNHFAHNRNFYAYYFQNGFDKKNKNRPELTELYSNGKMDDAYIERWWNRTTELARKYHPDLYYFDWGWNGPFWKNERPEFCSFFYNLAIRNGQGTFGKPEVVINYKNFNTIAKGCAVLDMERAKMSTPQSYIWQTDTSVSDYSWGYSTSDVYKSPKHLITLLADIVSKNGILMLAFGPKADGTIPDEYRQPMLEMGRWLKANGEAIYATRPWVVAEEGATDSNHEKAADLYNYRDIRYTQSKDGKTLYAISFGLPHSSLTLLATKVIRQGANAQVTMLANGKNIPFEVNAKKQLTLDMTEITAENAGCDYAYGFRIAGFELEGRQMTTMERSEFYIHDIEDYDPLAGDYASSYPYLSGVQSVYEKAHNGVKRDTNYHGKKIVIGGQAYTHGLMICPAGQEGRGVFVIGTAKLPKIKAITAAIGIDDAATERGSSAFMIDAFVKGKWVRLYKSRVLTYKDKAVEINVKIPAQTEFIRLVTTDGGNGGAADHAVWAEARFVQ